MEDAYIIQGGKSLRGRVTISGAKNVALKTIIAALLFNSKVVLKNVPRINDVFELLHLINKLGVKVHFTEKNTLEINALSLNVNKVDMLHSSKIRVSFLLFAPLLYRFGECFIPNPGGCRIGARPIDRIIEGMRSIGVQVSYNSRTGYYKASMKSPLEGEYRFEKPSHTGTELFILLGVLGEKTIRITNAALEPEIDQLIEFLNQSGARIKREGNRITVQGAKSLTQKKPYRISSDRNEAITFAVLAVASKGEILIEDIDPNLIKEFIKKIEEAGVKVAIIKKNKIKFTYTGSIRSVNIETSAHPGFMTDWQPSWAVLMTQSTGEATIHEKVFENRFAYVRELQKVGAHIDFMKPDVKNPKEFYLFNYNPKRQYQQMIKIHGGRQLHGGVLKIADLRAGASLVIGALIAKGESIVKGASTLERGYEDFVNKVIALGGDIKKL